MKGAPTTRAPTKPNTKASDRRSQECRREVGRTGGRTEIRERAVRDTVYKDTGGDTTSWGPLEITEVRNIVSSIEEPNKIYFGVPTS